MNLYGENGNIKMLQMRLKMGGIPFETETDIPDNLADYDFIYIGSGTERSLCAAQELLRPLTVHLAKRIADGAVILLTGNSMEMFGKRIILNDGRVLDGLGLLEVETEEDFEQPVTSDCVFGCDLFDEKVVGFINKATELSVDEKPLFSVDFGIGNNKNDKFEGVIKKNLFATHLIGPIMVKNPAFLEMIVERILTNKGIAYEEVLFENARKAHEVTLQELLKRG
jgi:CobQ-like glutamine amidotransferase family enzyme